MATWSSTRVIEILRERVKSLVAAGARLLLLDLHGLSYIDSGGMGALVELYSTSPGAAAG